MCHSPRVIRCSRLLISFRNSILMARTEYKPAHSSMRLWPTCSVRALCVWTAASAKAAPQSFFLFILATGIALTSLHDSWAERSLDYLVCCVDSNTSHVTFSLAQRTCFMMCDNHIGSSVCTSAPPHPHGHPRCAVVRSLTLCSSPRSFPCVSPIPCSSLSTSSWTLTGTSSSMWSSPRQLSTGTPPTEEFGSLAENTPLAGCLWHSVVACAHGVLLNGGPAGHAFWPLKWPSHQLD